MNLIFGPNLAIDETVSVPRLELGAIHRVPQVIALAGGKGAIACRALRALGGEPLLCGFAGGPVGGLLAAYLHAEGIAHVLVPTAAETRICFSVADATTGQQTEFYGAGAPVTAAEVDALRARAAECLEGQRWVAVNGSLPVGAPVDLYAQLLRLAHSQGAHTLLDARGAALAAGVAAAPDVLKINHRELEDLIGYALPTPAAVAHAAEHTIQLEAGASAIITLGATGAVLVARTGRWLIAAPAVQARSPVGSGDCVTAGVLLGLERGETVLTAARRGVAAGAANTLHLGAGRITRATVEELLPRCRVAGAEEAAVWEQPLA